MPGAGNIDLAKSILDKASKTCLVIEDLEPLERPEAPSVADVDSTTNDGGLLTTGQSAAVISRLIGCSSDAAKNLATKTNAEQAKVRLVEQQGRVCVHKYAAWRGAPAQKWSQFKCSAAAKSVCGSCMEPFRSVTAFAKANLAEQAAAKAPRTTVDNGVASEVDAHGGKPFS